MKNKINVIALILIIIINFQNISYGFSLNIDNLKKANTNTNNTNETTKEEEEEISDLQAKKDEISSNLTEENKNLEQIQNNLTDQINEIGELDEELTTKQEEIDKTNMKIYRLDTNIQNAQKYVDILEEEIDQKQSLLDTRLIEIYKSGNLTYLDIFLNAKNPLDFVNGYYLAKKMAQADQSLIQEIKTKKNQINDYQEEQKQLQIELADIKKQSLIDTTVIENMKIIRQRKVNMLSSQEKEVQNKIDQYNDEFAKVNAKILEIAKGQIQTNYIGGIFAWPVPGYSNITSEYGMRLHPITKIYKLHTGVDIGAPMGASFVAANDGIVTTATYNSAYGNMVIIDHGGGISTLYAHGSEILVKVGDYVTKNQSVLKVGSTGYSTGPHAHFEVRLDGIVTDPMPYITQNVEPENQ